MNLKVGYPRENIKLLREPIIELARAMGKTSQEEIEAFMAHMIDLFRVISKDTAERAGEPTVACVNFEVLDLDHRTVRSTLHLSGEESELAEFKAGEFYTIDIQAVKK